MEGTDDGCELKNHHLKTPLKESLSSSLNDESENEVEAIITIVNDTDSYFSFRCPKAENAIGVRGLTKEDEEEAIEQLRLQEELKLKKHEPHAFVLPLKKNWLLIPNVIGCFALLLSIGALCTNHVFDEITLSSDFNYFQHISRRRGEGISSCVYRARFTLLTLLPADLYALSLSFTVGTSTHHFSSLCGFGFSLLYFLCLGAQYYLLLNTVNLAKSMDGEIEVILSMMQVITIAKLLSPSLSFFLVWKTLCIALHQHPRRTILSILSTLPPLFILGALFQDTLGLPNIFNTILFFRVTTIFFGSLLFSCAFHSNSKEFEIPVVSFPDKEAED